MLKLIDLLQKQYGFIFLQFWPHHCFSLAMASSGCLVPSQLHHKTATVLPQLCHHSNGIFDPICRSLDLDVDQRGIKGAYWLKAAAVLKPQRGDCGRNSRNWQDPRVCYG